MSIFDRNSGNYDAAAGRSYGTPTFSKASDSRRYATGPTNARGRPGGINRNKSATGGGIKIPGGLFGGSNGARYAEEDYLRQKALNDEAYERSLPWDISGPLGSVTYDRENKTITQEMSDDARGVMERFLGRSAAFGDSISTYDPMEMQQNLYNQQRGLFTEQDNLARMRAEEQAIARGTSDSTVNYWDERARLDAINQRDLGLQADSFVQSQSLLDSQIAREQGYAQAGFNLAGQANPYFSPSILAGQGSHTAKNMAGMSAASMNWADALAAKSAGRSSMLGQFASSLFSV